MVDTTPAARTRLVALAGAVGISFSAIWVRLADVSPGTSTVFRPAYALPVLAVLWLAWDRKRDARRPRTRWLAFLAGLFLGLDLALWHEAIPRIGAGLATVLTNLQIVFVGALAWLVHKEKPTLAAAIAVPVAFAGVILSTGVGSARAYGADPVTGAVFAVGAALAYTGFLMFFRASGRRPGERAGLVGPLMDATAGTLVSGLALALLTDPAVSFVPEWPAHGWLLALAIGSHGLGWLAIAFALPRLPALETSALLLLQPSLTIVWAVLLFGEAPSVLQWLGVVLVMTGVASASFFGSARAPGAGGARDAPEADGARAGSVR